MNNFNYVKLLFLVLILLELAVLCYIWLDVFVFESIGEKYFVI